MHRHGELIEVQTALVAIIGQGPDTFQFRLIEATLAKYLYSLASCDVTLVHAVPSAEEGIISGLFVLGNRPGNDGVALEAGGSVVTLLTSLLGHHPGLQGIDIGQPGGWSVDQTPLAGPPRRLSIERRDHTARAGRRRQVGSKTGRHWRHRRTGTRITCSLRVLHPPEARRLGLHAGRLTQEAGWWLIGKARHLSLQQLRI